MRNKILFAFFLILLGTKSFAQVTVASSDSVTCSNPCTTLTATLTGDSPTNSGITEDDYYPAVPNPIGFGFNFYGTVYTQCLIGPNGTIDFNSALAGAYADYTITGNLAGDPTLLNSIAGPYCDIDITGGGIITYSLTGTAPYRKYIVSYCNDHMYQCTSQVTSAQIILYETTNIVEVHIGTKTVCPWNGGYAIIGVKNATGTASTAAPGRDFPSVYTCTNEAWRFTPDATFANYAVSSIPYAPVPFASSSIYWYNATTNTYLGTGLTQNVCPTTTTTYKAGALGCADTSFGYYTVVPSAVVTATYAVGTILACGGTTTLTISGLTPGLVDTVHYTLNGVPQPNYIATVSPGGTIVLSGIVAGTYVVYVTQGLCSTSPQTIVVPPPPITITAVPTNPTVCGRNGTILLSGYVPSTSYTVAYTQDGTPIAGSAYVSSGSGTITLSVPAGSYTNIVSTGGPCPPTTVAGPVILVNPAPPIVTVDSAFVKTCVGVPVQLHAYANPTLPSGYAYSYSWSPATDLSNPAISNPVATPAAVGNITYTVTANVTPSVAACASTAVVTVHAIGDFSITTPTATICLLTPRVSVPVTVVGSTEIAYAWTPAADVVSPTSASPVITPNTSGVHIYTVTGSYANCPDYVHTFTINVDMPATGSTVKDTICLGMSDVVDFTMPGTFGYHYAWTSSPAGVTFSNDTIPNPVFTPGAIGAYTLTAYVTSPSNAAGCGATNYVNLLVLPNAVTVSPVDTAICMGQVVQVNGTLAYNNLFTYQWLPTAGIANSTVLNTLITPDTSALYTLTASFHRCPDISATLNLDVQPNPRVYIGGNRPKCAFDTVHLNAQVTPAWYSNYIYSWTPAADLDNTTSSSVVFDGTSSTSVKVVVSTSAGCVGADSAYITVAPGNFVTTAANEDFCPHVSKTISMTPTSGISYQWFPSMYVSDSLSATPVISPITTQTYTIIGTTPGGCKDTAYWTATVYPDALIELGDSVTLYPGESYVLSPSSNCSSFTWFPYAGLDNPFVSNPTATPDVSTQYVVTGITEHGCVARDTVSIYVSEESLLAMPNAFVPGTGDNRTFKVILRGIVSLNYFRVYNRWGNLVFETKNISEGWDGTYKGEPQEMGVFIYDIQAVSSTGKVFHKTGNVTLLR